MNLLDAAKPGVVVLVSGDHAELEMVEVVETKTMGRHPRRAQEAWQTDKLFICSIEVDVFKLQVVFVFEVFQGTIDDSCLQIVAVWHVRCSHGIAGVHLNSVFVRHDRRIDVDVEL